MNDEAPRNRRERRAAAKTTGATIEPPSIAPKIKMVKPMYGSKPQGKTLMDIYEEKKSILNQGVPFDDQYRDGLHLDESGNILEAGLGGDGEPIGPIGDAIFWTVCLGMVHFTLDVMVYHQYAQRILWPNIFKRSVTILPVLFLLLYMLRSDFARRFAIARQFMFFAMSVGMGCYTITVGNNYDYFAVMKQTPPLGTIWIWCVIELNLPFAVTSLGLDLAFLWWNGYSAF